MHAYSRIACMRKNSAPETKPDSDAVRRHAYEKYVASARRRREKTVAINVGEVHRALALNNRVPLVCAALGSKKFLTEHGLRIVSKTGPPPDKAPQLRLPTRSSKRAKDLQRASTLFSRFGGLEKKSSCPLVEESLSFAGS